MPVIKKILELIIRNPQYIIIVYEIVKDLVDAEGKDQGKDTGKAS